MAVAVTTALIYPLKGVAPVEALGVVYLLGVLLVSSLWGFGLGVGTAVLSALAFNFFHIPPTGRFSIREGSNWVALAVFFVAAVVVSTLADRARAETAEARQRREEADLAAEMARLLLRGNGLDVAASTVSHRLAQALALPSAAIDLGVVETDTRRVGFALREQSRQIGTLVLPAGLPESTLARVQRRIVPSLEALLAAALERDTLLGDQVEASALRAGLGTALPAAALGRAQDRPAALGLSRPAIAVDRDPDRAGGAGHPGSHLRGARAVDR